MTRETTCCQAPSSAAAEAFAALGRAIELERALDPPSFFEQLKQLARRLYADDFTDDGFYRAVRSYVLKP